MNLKYLRIAILFTIIFTNQSILSQKRLTVEQSKRNTEHWTDAREYGIINKSAEASFIISKAKLSAISSQGNKNVIIKIKNFKNPELASANWVAATENYKEEYLDRNNGADRDFLLKSSFIADFLIADCDYKLLARICLRKGNYYLTFEEGLYSGATFREPPKPITETTANCPKILGNPGQCCGNSTGLKVPKEN